MTSVVAVRQDSEPAGFDWTAAGARTFHIDRCAVGFQRDASLPGNNGFTYGVIAPDPSPDITETPTSGMNSPFCLDGVQGNDELLRRGTRSTYARIERRESWRIAIRNPCHSLDGVRAARGRPSNRCLVHHPGFDLDVQPQRETLAQSTTDLIPRILAPHPLRHRSVVDPRQLAGSQKKEVKKQNNTGNYQCALLTSEAI